MDTITVNSDRRVSSPPHLTNRGVPSNQAAPIPVLVRGIDQLKLSVFGNWGSRPIRDVASYNGDSTDELDDDTLDYGVQDQTKSSLLNRLLYWKRKAMEAPEGVYVGYLFGRPVAVRRAGSAKKDGPYYPLVFEFEGLVIQCRTETHENIPTAVVTAGAMVCIQHRHELKAVAEYVTAQLRSLGLEFTENDCIPSRVDHCVDLGMAFQTAYQSFQAGAMVCRAQLESENGKMLGLECDYSVHRKARVPETVTIGRVIMLRVYDKGREMLRDEEKGNALRECYGAYNGRVTRVEWECKRDALKDRGIVTLVDLLERFEEFTSYLCRKWCRVLQGCTWTERRNLDRKKPVEWWATLQNAAVTVFEKLERKARNVGQSAKQWFAVLKGTFLSMCAELSKCPEQELPEELVGAASAFDQVVLGDGINAAVIQVTKRRAAREAERGKWWADSCKAVERAIPWWDQVPGELGLS